MVENIETLIYLGKQLEVKTVTIILSQFNLEQNHLEMLRVFSQSFIIQKQCRLSHKLLKELDVIKCVTFHSTTTASCNNKIQEDDKFKRIYYGTLTPQIRAVKLFSLCSSIAGLIAQPILIKEASTIGSTSLLVALCSVVGFFTFVTPLLLHLITKKYVTEIHYSPDKTLYRATTYNFFLLPKQLQFSPDDVVVPDIPGMFTTMSAKGKPLFIEARYFDDPLHYAKIMGYDKPLDLKLGEIDDSDTKQEMK